MIEGLLRGMVVVLAITGGLALLARALRAGARLMLWTAELTAVTGMAEISARRGDLTGLSERREAERDLRHRRRSAAARAVLWALCLVVPIAAGWLPGAFALAAPLWLLPLPPVRE